MAFKRRFSGSALLLAAAACLPACSSAPPQPPATPDPTEALARSLAIVNGATAGQPRVLKVLFYGQSISTPLWTDQATAELRKKYPNVAFDVRNLALGGWSSDILVRAVSRDIEEVYPDLIVFHVYGDHKAYEEIIRAFRSQTSADIVVQTDHVVTPPEPVCDTGIHLRWNPPPGCTGHVRFKQRIWEDYMSGFWIPSMAAKYGLAVEPRRARWNAHLKANGIAPTDLLKDNPHPNERGWTLMAGLFTSWFEEQAAKAARAGTQAPTDAVRSFAPPAPGTTQHYTVEGNRIELLATGPLAGKVTVTVDGKPARDFDGCWQNSRVSRLPNNPDWPALRRVSVTPSYREAEEWTLRVANLDETQDKFDFTLTSARGGAEGSGRSDEPFTSTSGRVSIDPQDWNLAYAKRVVGKGVAEGTQFTWTRAFVCGDQQPVALPNGRIEQRHVLATGLANGSHVVSVTLAADAPAATEMRAYKPPLE